MIGKVLLDGDPAYKIKAIKKSNIYQSMKSTLYDCEGDNIWLPNSVHKFIPNENAVLIKQWFYDKLIKEGKLS